MPPDRATLSVRVNEIDEDQPAPCRVLGGSDDGLALQPAQLTFVVAIRVAFAMT